MPTIQQLVKQGRKKIKKNTNGQKRATTNKKKVKKRNGKNL